MEEKVLLRFARAKRGGEALPVAPLLRADHGEIAVPTLMAAGALWTLAALTKPRIDGKL
jgi:hypothetical protein